MQCASVASKQHITLGRLTACTRKGQVFLLYMQDLQKNNKRTQKNLNIFLSWALMGLKRKVQNYQNKTGEKSLYSSKYVLTTYFKELQRYI